jgi:diguanylate cyclase (GGDEF)-like protein/PAS domain S-box-containing protein
VSTILTAGLAVLLALAALRLARVQRRLNAVRRRDAHCAGNPARERSRRAPQQNHDRLGLLMDSTALAIYGLDLDGRCTMVNRACLQALGYDSADQLLGRDMHEAMHHTRPNGQPYPPEECPFRDTVRGRARVHAAEEIAWRRDGTSFPAEFWSYPIMDGETHLGAVVSFVDISERVAAERGLQQARIVFEHSREAIMVTDAEPRITTVNPAFTELTGFSRAETIGRSPSLLSSGRHPPEFFDGVRSTLAEKGFWSGEIWNRRKDGAVLPQRVSVSAVTDNQGKVVTYVTLMTDITGAKRAQAHMEHLALHDPLTDLPNRLLAISRLEQSISRARRHGHRVAVLFIDLDDFKPVNDRFGHASGDRVLETVASRLSGTARASDTVARLGGDEFLVVMDSITQEPDAGRLAERLTATVREPIDLRDTTVRVTASIGIAVFPDDDEDGEQLIVKADTAMYRAKARGRNRIAYFGESA